jgi:hypothetical protein
MYPNSQVSIGHGEHRSLIQHLRARKQMLWTELSSWETHWEELSKFVLPRTGRFLTTDRNRGTRRHNNIIDSTATRALQVLEAGLMAGATSPARPWMRLTAPDPELNKFQPVKEWLHEVTDRMLRVFAQSNTYRALPRIYSECALYGTAASIVVSDFKSVIHHHVLTAGQYAISTDSSERVNCIYREFDMTVGQMVQEFGFEKVSTSVQNQFRNGNLEDWRTVCHAIEPRSDRHADRKNNKDMPFRSVYWEQGRTGSDVNTVLRESGFQRFPAIVPRWSVSGQDVYGNSPGMACLGDVKQLQHEQRRKGQILDHLTQPPTQGPPLMKNKEVDTLPGGHTEVDGNGAGIRPLWQVNPDLQGLLYDIQDVRGRINSSFYADLFLMLASTTKSMTATEVAERHEEKLLMLGPALERLHHEGLEPLIDITFNHMLEAGLVPPPPEELSGTNLQVEFVSMLAQAQRAVGASTDDRFIGMIQGLSQSHPEALDKLNTDNFLDEYADKLGVNPEHVRSTEEVAELRMAREQAMAAQAQMDAQSQQSNTTRNLAKAASDAPPDVMEQLTGSAPAE